MGSSNSLRYNVHVQDRRGKYGLDAPWAFAGLVAGTILLLALAVVSFGFRILVTGVAFTAGALYTLASAASHLYTARRGRFAVWEGELARLKGDEDVLDLGSGRGALLVLAARRLTTGHAIGVDSSDPAPARVNAEAEGVPAGLVTARLAALPFPDDRFDVVLSALALHRLPAADRDGAVREAYRVLRPGGLLLLADVRHIAEYENTLRAAGGRDVRARDLGWRHWYGGPWARTWVVEAVKP